MPSVTMYEGIVCKWTDRSYLGAINSRCQYKFIDWAYPKLLFQMHPVIYAFALSISVDFFQLHRELEDGNDVCTGRSCEV